MSKAAKLLANIFIICFFLLLFFSAALLLTFRHFESPPDFYPPSITTSKIAEGIYYEKDNFISFEIKAGESLNSIGVRLKEANLIRSILAWKFFVRILPAHIKAGAYRLDPPQGMLEIRNKLVNGEQLVSKITIPEGLTIRKIADILGENSICDPQAFVKTANDPVFVHSLNIPADSLEGYLYPETYFLHRNNSPQSVARFMVATFFERIDEFGESVQALNPQQLHEKIILSSIVEREYRIASEAPLMASVFTNRLIKNIGLESCATIGYILSEIEGKPHAEYISKLDTKIDNPYNTYKWAGLPPGPICSPGSIALDAVFNPVKTNYYYFRLVDPVAGRHAFTKTLEQHIQAGFLQLKSQN